MQIAQLIKNSFHSVGLEITRYIPQEIDEEAKTIIQKVLPYTMTSPTRIYALIQAVRYIVQKGIPGDIVECGVWKGGSMAAVALTLADLNVRDRKLLLFDTFSGMSQPTDFDVSSWGNSASDLLKGENKASTNNLWCNAPLELVRQVMNGTSYPPENISYIQGKVEDTIPEFSPSKVSLLRLDTDWYESTRHELNYLYPLLSHNGILILDDYGSWLGARKAVDEYFGENHPLLHRIDDTGRIAHKV